jgi:hypothetical protein
MRLLTVAIGKRAKDYPFLKIHHLLKRVTFDLSQIFNPLQIHRKSTDVIKSRVQRCVTRFGIRSL